MRILVIGSEGFIGKNISNFFIKNGDEVVGIDFKASKALTVKYKFIRILSFNYNLEDLLESFIPDVLIFAGGSANIQLSIEQPNLDFEANVVSVSKLLESVRKINLKCKFIHFSSAAVYGNPKSLPINEDDNVNPLSPYGWHKYQAELLCKEYYNVYKLPTCNLRPFSVYGPGQYKLLFWDLFQKMKEDSSVVNLYGTGNETRDFIFIDDLLNAIQLIIKNGDFKGTIYNIASGSETSIHIAANIFKKSLGIDKEIKFIGTERIGDPLYWNANIAKISALGFNVNTNLESGLKLYLKWLQEKQ